MSTHHNIRCWTCEDKGPAFRRSPSGSGIVPSKTPSGTWEDGMREAIDFLTEHEWCDVRIEHE